MQNRSWCSFNSPVSSSLCICKNLQCQNIHQWWMSPFCPVKTVSRTCVLVFLLHLGVKNFSLNILHFCLIYFVPRSVCEGLKNRLNLYERQGREIFGATNQPPAALAPFKKDKEPQESEQLRCCIILILRTGTAKTHVCLLLVRESL